MYVYIKFDRECYTFACPFLYLKHVYTTKYDWMSQLNSFTQTEKNQKENQYICFLNSNSIKIS